MAHLQLPKKIFKHITIRVNQVHNLFRYGIPLRQTPVDPNRLVNFFDFVGPIESAAIIGKGASIFESNPKKLIQGCDFKCLLNSVDVEHVEDYIGGTLDAQMTTRVDLGGTLVPVLPRSLIQKYGIRILICNSTLDYANGLSVRNYWNFFNDRVARISYVPRANELEYDVDIEKYSKEGRVTIAANLLRMLYNIPTLNKIVFAGVDAFHYQYSYRPGISRKNKFFYSINATSLDPRKTHGLPFLHFLFDSLGEINEQRRLDAFFPSVLRNIISFPNQAYIRFYD